MAQSTIKIIAFNNLLKEMILFLKTTFKSEKKLTYYEFQIKTVILSSPQCMINLFKEFVVPYENKINACDEEFMISELNSIIGGKVEFLDFSTVWSKQENTLEVKAKIFQYFIKLIKLSR